jgi:SAM-dependent methyltransferase
MLSMGAAVTAVEANASMAAYLYGAAGCAGALEILVAPFETADLPDHAVDLAVAATSFHWVDRNTGMDKLRRVVRPGGWVAMWWMLFEDPTRPDDFTAAAQRVLGASPSSIMDPGRPQFQIDEAARRSELQQAGFVDVASELIASQAQFDAARVRALYASMAIVLRRPPDEQTRVLDTLEALVADEFAGTVERHFLTALYTARNPPS